MKQKNIIKAYPGQIIKDRDQINVWPMPRSANEHRVVNTFLYLLQQTESQTIYIDKVILHKVMYELGSKGGNQDDQMLQILKNLMALTYAEVHIKDDRKVHRFRNMLEFVDNENFFIGDKFIDVVEGYMAVKFTSEIYNKMMTYKKNLTIQNIAHQLRLKNKYSPKLYDLLTKEASFTANNVFKGYVDFTIKDLRNYLYIAKDEYKLYGHLKSRIIIPSLKEINELTDLKINMVDDNWFEEFKKGRSVESIRIYCKLNRNTTKDEKLLDLLEQLVKHSLSEEEKLLFENNTVV